MKPITKQLIENLQSSLDTQSRIAISLDASGEINEQIYNSENLLDATQIFMSVLGNVSIGYGIRKGLTKEQMIINAEKMGKNIKQTILLSTGIDVPSLAKRLYNN